MILDTLTNIEKITYAILLIIIIILIYKIITAKRPSEEYKMLKENENKEEKTEETKKGRLFNKKDMTEDFELGKDKIKINRMEKFSVKMMIKKLITKVEQVKHKKEREKEEQYRQELITQTMKIINDLELEITLKDGKEMTEIDLQNMKTDELIELHEQLIRDLAETFDIKIEI